VLLKQLRRKQYAETTSPRPPRAEAAVSEAQARHAGLGSDRASDGGSGGGLASKKRSRYIPRHVRREVARRDGFQCAYVDPQTGRRCPQRGGGSSIHHRDPFAKGGATTAANVFLACPGHNGAAAVADYGTAHIARRIAEARRAGEQRWPAGGSGASGSSGGGEPPKTRGTARPRPPAPP
jgi:hypothetical protein